MIGAKAASFPKCDLLYRYVQIVQAGQGAELGSYRGLHRQVSGELLWFCLMSCHVMSHDKRVQR